ncbi:L-threonine ammonia-lyase-like [Liolophura sinensis]|uniref:L-threonine ammonia-lyase-like n=1 Tax=Liolophura sinensis TaxID=3198878 RepID=UPI0031595CC9
MSDTKDDVYELITEEQIRDAEEHRSPEVRRTPLLSNVQTLFPEVEDKHVNLSLKLESMQTTGSFKFRGIMNQIRFIPPEVKSGEKKLITMSAGNYGKAFGHVTKELGLKGLCLIPKFAPANRVDVIKGYGVEIIPTPNEELQPTVDRYVQEMGYVYTHPFDDLHLIAGYSSLGSEILESRPLPDVVVVCCGGGGVLAGVATAIKLRRPECKVYGVEPERAPTMFESFKAGHAVTMPSVKSIASGLSPPFAGKITYNHCRKYVDDILLVSDDEIRAAVKRLYHAGLVVEASGSAAMAAMLFDKIPDVNGKNVVIVITGGNVTPDELVKLCE